IEGIEFVPLPVVEMVKNYDGYNLRWNDLEVGAIIGYGVYQNGSRLNENIVAENSYAVKTIGSYEVRPVFIGGYETALTTTGLSAIDSDWNRPNSFSFMLTTSNPNRGNVQLKYELPVDSKVEIVIYDITGRLIRRLFKGTKESGYHSSFWSGDDESGTLVPSGIYFIELKASELRVNRKIILQR
ncbi:MAG: FlgD immunoglobulin-like domain containing protein, partial [candidate division WOR-3 bacterium]